MFTSRNGSPPIIPLQGNADLAEITDALDAPGPLLGLGQRGQEHCGEYRNDRNDHEQFNQRECAPLRAQGGLTSELQENLREFASASSNENVCNCLLTPDCLPHCSDTADSR